VEAGRHFALGVPADGSTWKVAVWSIGILIIFIPLAIRQYKRRTN